jgi:hypothetical protein
MVGFWHLPKVRSCGPHRTSSICVFVRGLKKRQKNVTWKLLAYLCHNSHHCNFSRPPFVSSKSKIYTIFNLWYKINITISHLPSHNISLWCYQMTWSEHNWIIWIYVWQENLNFIIIKQQNLIHNFIPLFDVVKTFCWNNAHEEQMKSFNWTS